MSKESDKHSGYKQLRYFIKQYAPPGVSDQRAAQSFVDVEPDYLLKSLKSELYGVSKGKYDEESMGKIVGIPRKLRHGSYDEWARLILVWMAEYK